MALMGPSVCLKHRVGSDVLVESIDAAELPRPPEVTVVLMNPGRAGIANDELPRPPEGVAEEDSELRNSLIVVEEYLEDPRSGGIACDKAMRGLLRRICGKAMLRALGEDPSASDLPGCRLRTVERIFQMLKMESSSDLPSCTSRPRSGRHCL